MQTGQVSGHHIKMARAKITLRTAHHTHNYNT